MNTSTDSREGSAPERQQHPSPHRHRVPGWAVWFGLLGAPLAWSLQELVNVSLAGYACFPHDTPLAAPLWPNLVGIAMGVDVVALVACVAAGLAAFYSWRRSREEKPGDAGQLLGSGDGRTRFMAMAGMMTSMLFLIATLLAILNLAGVPPCGG
jgi:formate hydrogenlyase subunit 3/multisubunit Na+/H+ antiporter MnhD subunit